MDVIQGQFDIFGATPAPQVISQTTETKPAPVVRQGRNTRNPAPSASEPEQISQVKKMVTCPAIPDDSVADGDVVFDATDWYGTPENRAKLDQALAALAPGDKWINGHGVTEVYLGVTIGGYQLHRGPEGEHVYAKYVADGLPMKQYRPTTRNGMTVADFMLAVKHD